MQKKLLGIISVDFDVKDQLLIRYSIFVRYWRKNGSTVGQQINYLQNSRRPITQERKYSH
jgi:hypothetical protein